MSPKIFDLYSKRLNEEKKAGKSDVYQYEMIPTPVLNQIVMIMDEAIGRFDQYEDSIRDNSNDAWSLIIEALAREYGTPNIILADRRQACSRFLLEQRQISKKLDLIELAFRLINVYLRKKDGSRRRERNITLEADDAIEELNYRLREGGVGFQFENNRIIRVDSQYVHAEVVKSALSLLHGEAFSGAEDEFMSAHAHYRQGEYKDAIVDAGAAFESAMKTICDRKNWKYEKGARASDLLKVLQRNKLFPDYLDKSFEQLVAVLKSGLPEVRNNEGSHGQGASPKQTPDHVAAYALHLAATNMVFLVKCLKDLEQ